MSTLIIWRKLGLDETMQLGDVRYYGDLNRVHDYVLANKEAGPLKFISSEFFGRTVAQYLGLSSDTRGLWGIWRAIKVSSDAGKPIGKLVNTLVRKSK